MSTHNRVIDCHTHVFLPDSFGYVRGRSYTPGVADAEMLSNHMGRVGAEKVILVQPSPYGSDNRATLHALDVLGPDRARAVVVVSADQPSAIPDLVRAGVVGVRANLKTRGVAQAEDAAAQIAALESCLKGTDLALQVYLPLEVVLGVARQLVAIGRPVILDHFAGLQTAKITENDVGDLLDLLASPNIYLKASGACRVVGNDANFAALDPIAPRLFAAAKGRVIWGSDWPHTSGGADRRARPLTEIEPFRPIDDRAGIEAVSRWCGEPEMRRDVLWNAANQLFFLINA